MGIPEYLRTKAIGGVSFHFDVLLGHVAAEKKWSETRVWGGGGGGHVGRRGGNLIRSKEQGRVGLVCNLATGTQFDDPALCLHLAKTYASSPFTAAALSLLAVLAAGGIIWSGMWLLGFLALIPGFALARNIAQAQVEDRAKLIRRHLTVVNKSVVENLISNANAEGATVVNGKDAPTP